MQPFGYPARGPAAGIAVQDFCPEGLPGERCYLAMASVPPCGKAIASRLGSSSPCSCPTLWRLSSMRHSWRFRRAMNTADSGSR
eukprot:5344930-Amphidinium_carterae.1